jgi:hypothetical protein
MARVLLLVVLAAVSVFLVPAVTASCDDELPAELAGNYSGMACSPVWNNFVLRVRTCRQCSVSSIVRPRPSGLDLW